MFLRKIGKLLRGKATPFQIISATLIGGLLGSLPGLSQSPLLVVLLLFSLIILNANLFLAGLTLLLAKLVYLILLPIYFNVGVTLLEGPLGSPLTVLVNAPVTAWFGLDYYVVVPALIVGAALGLFLGVSLSRILRGFRSKMAGLESGSERYQAYTSKFWVKGIAWLFIGGVKGKKSWAEMSDLKGGLMVRPIGIFLVVCLAVLGFIGFKLLDETIVTSNVRDALEEANTATVDIDSIQILPVDNRIIISGLAMADPENLQSNRFASTEIVADISGMNLLAKKVVIDSLQIREPSTGTARRIAGQRTAELPEVEEIPPESDDVIDINDYLGNSGQWRERLAMAKRMYEKIAPQMKKEKGEEEDLPAGAPGWREQLAQRAAELGYGKVKSDSLIRNSPRMWIRDLSMDNLVIGGSEERFAIHGTDLSSQPALLDQSGQLTISREDGRLDVSIGLPSTSDPSRSVVKVRYSDLEISELESKTGKDLPMEGGSMDIVGEGAIDNAVLDIPLTVTLKDTTLSAFGQSLPLDELPLQVRIHGPMDQPKLDIPKDALENAMKKGGQKAVENLILEKSGEELKKILPFGG